MEGSRPEALFRANKRRKIIRKRNADDEEETRLIDGQAIREVENDRDDVPSVVKRPAAKKQGVIFTSTGAQVPGLSTVSTETALVPFSGENAQVDQVSQHDRFTKPMGRAEVVEDKHLTAYVDSKLAEMRSTTATPLQNAASQAEPGPESESSELAHDSAQAGDGRTGTSSTSRDSTGEQRKGHPYGRNRNSRPRRQPAARDEESLARDAMIDQILGESEVPLYDRASTAAVASSSSGIDADEAAAQAFKEQFLASLAENNRRKPPPPPPNSRAAKEAAKVAPSGPKLGGSRSQREKMRALEEAKNAMKK